MGILVKYICKNVICVGMNDIVRYSVLPIFLQYYYVEIGTRRHRK